MDHDWRSRRRVLRLGGAAGLASIAGCNGLLGGPAGGASDGDGDDGGDGADGVVGQVGSGRSPFGERTVAGVSMSELPDLSGELTLYSGRGEPLVGQLIGFIEDLYSDLTIRPRYNTAAELVNQIETEGSGSPADVFYSVNAGSLGALKDRGRTAVLPAEVLDTVPDQFRDRDGTWIGTSGRARTVPYNTDELADSDVPDDIFGFPETEAFRDAIGCAPSYSSFQAFITAMRTLNGEDETREWLNGMLDLGLQHNYADEFLVSQAVADGELVAGFANHYYIQRVLAGRPDAPIATAFTEGDAGAIFNVAGAAVLDTATDADLASNFVHHLLSAEAQDYFARETFEYPLVPGVEPIGRLPTIDELNPPEGLNLTQLSDLEGTVDLLREVGLL